MPENASWRWVRRPAGSAPRIEFGADYNPDPWPRAVWDDDVKIMQAAGVTVVSVAIFSWARLQPDEESWDFSWLDEVMDLMHASGIGVDLATATASPPPWLATTREWRSRVQVRSPSGAGCRRCGNTST